jgi:hypothetical protein
MSRRSPPINSPGQVLAHAQRTLSGFMGGASAVTTVSLAPGGFASATVEWLNFNPVTAGDCTFSASMAATPANTTHTVRLPVSVSVCQLQVHPTVAGTSGQGTPSQVPAGSGGFAATNDSSEQQRIVLAGIRGALLLLGAGTRRCSRPPVTVAATVMRRSHQPRQACCVSSWRVFDRAAFGRRQDDRAGVDREPQRPAESRQPTCSLYSDRPTVHAELGCLRERYKSVRLNAVPDATCAPCWGV